MADKASYKLIGKSIIIGAVFSSVISIIQLIIDPYFLRIGDGRLAFGNVLRSNGIFHTEYFNSYFLITAIAWTLITIKNKTYKYPLLLLFSIGVLSSFMRMSWVVYVLVIVIYLVFIERAAIEKLLLTGLSGLAIMLTIFLIFNREIMNSSLVKDRLSEKVDSRAGYYAMVIDNIHKKPLFGFGDLYNEVYYHNLLRITGSVDRAVAKEGDLHSGYFTALFLFGIPALVLFILFVVFSVIYFAKLSTENIFFAIPFFISIIYMIGNITNNFLPLEYLSVLYAIHLGIGMGTKQMNSKLHFSQ